jgi:hypothetical protein
MKARPIFHHPFVRDGANGLRCSAREAGHSTNHAHRHIEFIKVFGLQTSFSFTEIKFYLEKSLYRVLYIMWLIPPILMSGSSV